MKALHTFEVVSKAFFAFVLHGMYDFKVFHVKGVWAVFIVLRYSRVVPLFLLYGPLMFLPSSCARAVCLANVYGFRGACACVLVDAFALFLGGVCLIVATEYVFEL